MSLVPASAARTLALLLCLALGGWLAWSSALDGQYTNLDDEQNVVFNSGFRGFDAVHLEWMLRTDHMGNYQPPTWLSFALDHALFDLEPRATHRTQVVLHLCAGLAVFGLARALLRRCREPGDARAARQIDVAAALAAWLWLAHPLRAENVAWISGRGEIVAALPCVLALWCWVATQASAPKTLDRRAALSALFCALWALAFFWLSVGLDDATLLGLRGPGGWGLAFAGASWLACAACSFRAARGSFRGVAAYGAFALLVLVSLCAKAYAAVLPAVLLLLDVYPLRRFTRANLGALLIEKLPLAVLSVAFARLAFWAKAGSPGSLKSLVQHPLSERLLQSAYGLAFYVRKSLWPADLSPMYELPARIGWSEPRFLVAALLVLGCAWILVRTARRCPGLAAVLGAYALLIFPLLGLFQAGAQLVADRYSYLPCIALAIGAAGGWLWVERERPSWTAGTRWLAAIAVLGQGVWTWDQASVWHDSRTLYEHALAVEESPRLLTNLALVYNELGASEPARRASHLQRALALSERALALARERDVFVPEFWLHHGTILLNLGRGADAAADLEAFTRARPESPDGWMNLGLARESAGRKEDAASAYERVLALVPDLEAARRGLERTRPR